MEKPKNNNGNLISLVKEFINEIISLAHQHFELFKLECKEDAFNFIKSIILLTAALLIGYTGLIFLGILIIFLLFKLIPAYIALLLVVVVYFGIPLGMFFYSVYVLKKIFKGPKKSVLELKKTGEQFKTWLNNLKK